MIAAVHVDPRITMPIAILIAAGLMWFWYRLGRPEVPASRRRVRRVSVFLMLLSLPAFVRGLSFLDRSVPADQADYLLAWSIGLLLVLAVFLTACVDILVSMRLHRREYEKEIERAGAELREAVRRRREEEAEDASASPEDNST
jgi:4-amino-4-deoxy-L-arabinose transferase-like glycosyltransferase